MTRIARDTHDCGFWIGANKTLVDGLLDDGIVGEGAEGGGVVGAVELYSGLNFLLALGPLKGERAMESGGKSN